MATAIAKAVVTTMIGTGALCGLAVYEHFSDDSSHAYFAPVVAEDAQDKHFVDAAMKTIPKNREFSTVSGQSVTLDVLNNMGFSEAIARWKSLSIEDSSHNKVQRIKHSDGAYSIDPNKQLTFSSERGYTGQATSITCVAVDKSGHSYRFTVSGNVEKPKPSYAAASHIVTSVDTPVSINYGVTVTMPTPGTTLTDVSLAGSDSKGVLKLKEGLVSLNKTSSQVLFIPAKSYVGMIPTITLNLVDSNGFHFTEKMNGQVIQTSQGKAS